MIVNIADSYVTKREEFELISGYQPIDSLFYLKKGSFWYKTNEGEFFAKSGDIIIFNKSVNMERRVVEPIEFLYVKFHLVNSGLFEINVTAPIRAEGRIKDDLLFIERLSDTQSSATISMRNHYLNDLFITLLNAERVSSAKTSAVSSSVFAPIEFIEQHLDEKLTVADVARQFSMSVSSLESKFVKVVGKSIYDYLIDTRINHAKNLLTQTQYSVSEISLRCGYDTVFYFCNAFKKHTQCTPTQYRKNFRNLI